MRFCCFFFFQAEDGIRDLTVTGVQTCALPICDCDTLASSNRPSCRCSAREKRLGRPGTGGRRPLHYLASRIPINRYSSNARFCYARGYARDGLKSTPKPPHASQTLKENHIILTIKSQVLCQLS